MLGLSSMVILADAIRAVCARGPGLRAEQALKFVHAHPGITLQELAKRMKLKANYLYKVLPQLEKEGKVKKRDKGYHPPES